jgi:hypothetical protein
LASTTAKVFSIYAKAAGFSHIKLYDGFNGGRRTWFNVATGAVGTTDAGHTASIIDVGNGWYRCVVTTSVAWGAGADLGWALADADGSTTATANGTDGVFLWGAQLEQRSAVTAYTKTEAQPITRYIPQLMTAAANVWRKDHDPITGECLGRLVEESRTNLLTWSEDFGNAAWLNTNITIVPNHLVAPDGMLGADVYSPAAIDGFHFLESPLQATTIGAAYTFSLYVKPAGYNQLHLSFGASRVYANFNLLTGTLTNVVTNGTDFSNGSAAITPLPNGWFRCSVTFTALGTTSRRPRIGTSLSPTYSEGVAGGTYTGDGYSGIYIWGAQ